MSKPVVVCVAEEIGHLKGLISQANRYSLPRLRMLQAIVLGTNHNVALAAKTGASLSSIMLWKKTYQKGGLAALLSDKRGGDHSSNLSEENKAALRAKLQSPTDAFTSFKEAHQWVNDTFGTTKSYSTVNSYIKRNYGASLKVGRKSHVKKEEAKVQEFKKKSSTHFLKPLRKSILRSPAVVA